MAAPRGSSTSWRRMASSVPPTGPNRARCSRTATGCGSLINRQNDDRGPEFGFLGKWPGILVPVAVAIRRRHHASEDAVTFVSRANDVWLPAQTHPGCIGARRGAARTPGDGLPADTSFPCCCVLSFMTKPELSIAGRGWRRLLGLYALFGGVMTHFIASISGILN